MFRIKICGVRSVADATVAAEAGADAIGLNFYPPSPRCLDLRQAVELARALRGRVARVGVLVNPAEEEMMRVLDQVELDAVQLQGDEPPEMVVPWSRRIPIIKAFRIGLAGLEPVFAYLREVRRLGGQLQAVLFDAYAVGSPGGTGKRADWEAILASGYPRESWHPPHVLAGGLNPDNVALAIRTLRPAAVDTASGVESAPGQKDPVLVRRFAAEAEAAFRATHCGGL